MSDAKPAVPSGGGNRIIISDWRSHSKGTLKGFFDATLASGMILRGLMLHQRDESRWIGLPAREWTDNQGVKQYSKIVDFTNRAVADRFKDSVLDALDKYLEGLKEEPARRA
jgi:hypothetical protein